VAYTPEWEAIGNALKRLAASAVSESEAKRDLCSAISDGAIAIRVRLAADRYRCLPASVIPGSDLPLPLDLSPEHLDWQRSRPLQPWAMAQRQPGEWVTTFASRAGHLVDRNIELIEVRRPDVGKVFGGPVSEAKSDPTRVLPKRESGAGAKSRAVIQAIEQLWPEGVPAGLSAKDRNKRILEWLRTNGLSVPLNPERAIQRALAQLRSRQLAP
jgi:hypothetical protein